jgi:hypothetical protein
MSIDRCYAEAEGGWKRLDEIDLQHSQLDFWVDLSHGANILIDERYYFSSLAAAEVFYTGGWKERQYLDDNCGNCGLNIELYANGKLVQHDELLAG